MAGVGGVGFSTSSTGKFKTGIFTSSTGKFGPGGFPGRFSLFVDFIGPILWLIFWVGLKFSLFFVDFAPLVDFVGGVVLISWGGGNFILVKFVDFSCSSWRVRLTVVFSR